MEQTSWMSWVGHALGVGSIGATLAGVAPPVAAFVAFTFYMIQIWESQTVQNYVRNWRTLQKTRKIARLKAKQKVVTAKLDALEVVRAARVEAKELVATAAVEAEKLKVAEDTKHQVELPPV